jgi:hypothetical protein
MVTQNFFAQQILTGGYFSAGDYIQLLTRVNPGGGLTATFTSAYFMMAKLA